MIADEMKTDHNRIKRILVKNEIKITIRPTLKPYTDEHRRKVGLASKGRQSNLGKTMPKSSLYKNMETHLKYKVSLEWLEGFEDIEKLKFLNKSISRTRDRRGFTDKTYKMFIEKFYYDKQFNDLYNKWLQSDKNKWMRPSLDHIKSRSKKGSLVDMNNLQFLSWLENRTKADMSDVDWRNIKKNIEDYLV